MSLKLLAETYTVETVLIFVYNNVMEKNAIVTRNNIKPRFIVLLIVLSVFVCAAFCFMLWSAEKNNPLPAAPAFQSGTIN